ncbi:protein kinase domain-containing protein, partial [Haematococcus lacustris]
MFTDPGPALAPQSMPVIGSADTAGGAMQMMWRIMRRSYAVEVTQVGVKITKIEHSNAARRQYPGLKEELAVGGTRCHVGAEGQLRQFRHKPQEAVQRRLQVCKAGLAIILQYCQGKAACRDKWSHHAIRGRHACAYHRSRFGEADPTGNKMPLTTEAQMNARFQLVVGRGVVSVLNACIRQKQPTWGELFFQAESRPSGGLGWPGFLIKQAGVNIALDVCGGEGKASVIYKIICRKASRAGLACFDIMIVVATVEWGTGRQTRGGEPISHHSKSRVAPMTVLVSCLTMLQMPDVMCQAVIDLTDRHGVGPEVLTQACSYCQEKGWRFTFITSYQYTFFVWRVAEDRYAVTDGLLHDAAPHDLYTREVLAYIIWMSLEAPWGRQLPPGELHDLEVLLKQQAPATVLHGRPQVQQSQVQQDQVQQSQVQEDQVQQDQVQQSQVQQDQVQQGSNQLQQTPTAPLHALRQRDQPAPWVTIEDAPEYPPESLQFSSMRLGAGQCGPVVQGWLQEVPVAIKATDACKSPDIVQMLWHEAKIYDILRDLQGHLLPVLHGCGYWKGRNNFFLATAVVPGKPINSCKGVAGAQATAQAARQALQAIHQRGVAHGDVRADNIMVQYFGSIPQ